MKHKTGKEEKTIQHAFHNGSVKL